MKDDKGLKRFFPEKAEEYLLYFEHFSGKNLFKAAVRFHFKHLNLKRFGYILLTLICIFLFACSKYTQQNFDKIKNNMAMKEVIAILGEPTDSESVNIMGIAGTSAVWKDKNAEIDIQFLNNVVVVKAFSKLNEEHVEKINKK